MRTSTTIGLAVGRGTGTELAEVFERVMGRLGDLLGVASVIARSPRVYHSYHSLRAEGGGITGMRRLTDEDAAHYAEFCRQQARQGTTAIFRTAINAQTLYLVRQRLRAVKAELIGPSLLLIRDQAQGFYTGENQHAPGSLTRTLHFSRDVTHQVIAYALARARRQWPDSAPQVVMAYKFHLLDGAFDEWVREAAEQHHVPIGLWQPDTVNRNLIEHGLPQRTVLIAGNEWADIMHVMLLDRYGGQRQESRHTENIYLHPDVAGLVEYQTVHGSADDLTGLDAVNPIATARAAAAILEGHAGGAGAVAAMEQALAALAAHGVRTRDLGGTHTTTAVVDALLSELSIAPGGRDGSVAGRGSEPEGPPAALGGGPRL